MTRRIVYVAVGLAALAFVLILTWFDLTVPLNLRQPVVSPDGQYFAYFDRVRKDAGTGSGYDLIVSTLAGEVAARYAMAPGTITWSSAGHLMVERENFSQATLIPKAAGSFLVLTTLALSPGTHPLWARSGTKFALVQKGSAGLQISVYDLLQTESAVVPLPPTLHLDHPILLFWSPGGQELYFASRENQETVLFRANVISGEARTIARSLAAWGAGIPGLPSISPDGTRICLPKPQQSVIDADSGAVLWTLPAGAKLLRSPWSGDGTEIYYSTPDGSGSVSAHDFAKGTDLELLAGVSAEGFFSEDGQSYLFRRDSGSQAGGYGSRLGKWLGKDRGWDEVETASRNSHSLGRDELWPYSTTRDGLILTFRDTYSLVRYGLFDPKTLAFTRLHIPTDREDAVRMLKSRAFLLLAVGLYGLLGFFVFLARPASAPARALYALSLILMLLFISLDLARSLAIAYGPANRPPPGLEFDSLGWTPLLPRAYWLADQFPLFLVFLSCVPAALLRFSLRFPERSRFLAGRETIRALLYVAALLPAAIALASIPMDQFPESIRPYLVGLAVTSGAVAIVAAFLALLYNHRHPPDRRAREQVRWVLIAFSVPAAGSLLLFAIDLLSAAGTLGQGTAGADLQYIHGVVSTSSLGPLWLFAPLAIGYALLAHKLFDIQLLFQRTVRYSLLTSVVAFVYLLLAVGISWAIYGSLGKPSMIVLVVATLLTAIILAPARTRLERVIDRNFSREHFDFQETLQSFTDGLPNITDRTTLSTVTSRMVRGAMKTQTFHLFTFDRSAGKLRLEKPEPTSKGGARGALQGAAEFDPGEPLCRFLLEKGRPFEVEVSPYDPKLIPIFQSAADRLSSLRAAIIFGLTRRRQLVGLMTLGEKITDEFYNSEDIKLLQNVARQAAIAIEKTEVFEEAARHQKGGAIRTLDEGPPAQFSPAAAPKIVGGDLAGCSNASPSGGGDYYDFVVLPGEKVGLAIGCIAGKRQPSTELKLNLHSLLNSDPDAGKNLPAVARRINRQLFTSFRGAKYCTFFYSVYDPKERRLEFVNAGHNPPLVLGPKGIRFLAAGGVPLGLFAESTLEPRLATLEPGASLVLYSEGVTSARDPMGELFGLDRLMASVTRAAGQDAAGMAEKILSDIRDFTDRRPLEEDRTVVVMKLE